MIQCALYLSGILLAAHGANKNPDAVRAHALSDEGRRLMAAGDYASACPKMASSQALDPGAGIAASLAACYEKAGKLASAWEALRGAENAAVAAGRKDRAAVAKKKADALKPKLSQLTVTVPSSAQVPGLEVSCDGAPIQAAQWGVPVPRDGGAYEIQAAAPGKKTWSKHVELRPSGQNLAVELPPLEDVAPPPSAQADVAPPEVAEPEGQHPGRTQRVLGLVLGGTGVVGMGVGGVVALMAKSQMNTAQSEPNPAAHNDSASAVNTGNLATLLVAVGAAVTVGGAIVWLTAPDATVTVGASGSTLLVKGTF